MATKVFVIDLKAINETYPDTENSKTVMESTVQVLQTAYENLRLNLKQGIEYQKAFDNALDPRIVEARNKLKDTITLDEEYPAWAGNVTTAYVIEEGRSYNDVVTITGTLTVTAPDNAVKLINQLNDILGTFSINPTNRLTGY